MAVKRQIQYFKYCHCIIVQRQWQSSPSTPALLHSLEKDETIQMTNFMGPMPSPVQLMLSAVMCTTWIQCLA